MKFKNNEQQLRLLHADCLRALVFRLTVSKGWNSGLQVICYITVYFLPDPFSMTRQAHKDTTAQPVAALLSSVSYPILPFARREMLLHLLLECQIFFFSLQRYFISKLDTYYFAEMPTTKIR